MIVVFNNVEQDHYPPIAQPPGHTGHLVLPATTHQPTGQTTFIIPATSHQFFITSHQPPGYNPDT